MFQKKITAVIIAVFVVFTLSFGTTGCAQTIPDSTRKKIDALFKKWDNPGSPGCTIGVVMSDSLVYAKGYGMANLEYGVPNSPETIFHIASVSKQFTAYAIVLLEQQGKLKLDDDVHLYLPWFVGMKEKITIRQLLNHTSGIRDQWQLLAIAGTRIDDVITQDHIIKILSRQRSLNFAPGEQYSYSNSGYTMAAEIIKSVTGQSLRQFTDSAIFKPLGMLNTHFHDDYTEIVKNRAYSYSAGSRGGYVNSILSYSTAGPTSLFTNILDMARWIKNFYDPGTGIQRNIGALTQKGKLNSGKELDYALGIEVERYKGWKQYNHSGGDAGYRTYISVFPDLKMGFIVFSNDGSFFPWMKANAMADLFIKDNPHAATPVKNTTDDKNNKINKNKPDSIPTEKQLPSYTGTYYCPELECSYRIVLKDHSLLLTSNKYPDTPLKFTDTNEVTCDHWFMSHLTILRDAANMVTGFEVDDGRIMHLRFNKIQPL